MLYSDSLCVNEKDDVWVLRILDAEAVGEINGWIGMVMYPEYRLFTNMLHIISKRHFVDIIRLWIPRHFDIFWQSLSAFCTLLESTDKSAIPIEKYDTNPQNEASPFYDKNKYINWICNWRYWVKGHFLFSIVRDMLFCELSLQHLLPVSLNIQISCI